MITKRFDTLEALAEYAARAPRHGDARGMDATPKWDFSTGFEGALRLALDGWPEGAEQARKIQNTIPDLAPVAAVRRGTRRNVEGAYPDVQAALRGEPESMVEFRRVKRPAFIARIVASTSIMSTVNARHVMIRGAAIAALVDMLETRGTRCEVLARKPHDGWQTEVVLKEPSEALNLDRLAFGLAHPAFNRRLNFAVQELETDAVQKAHRLAHYGGYGWNAPIVDPGAIVFEGMRDGIDWTPEYAAALVRQKVEEFEAARSQPQ